LDQWEDEEMIICEHPHCFWRDKEGNPWHMDWTFVGPIFSRNNFEDGGIELKEVPEEIKIYAEQWAKKVRGENVIISSKTKYKRTIMPRL